MNKATEARLQAEHDIKIELSIEGKVYISLSLKGLILRMIREYEQGSSDMLETYNKNYKSKK